MFSVLIYLHLGVLLNVVTNHRVDAMTSNAVQPQFEKHPVPNNPFR